jgi:NTE family protein
VIDFDSLADKRRRRCFKRLPTTLELSESEVDALRVAGRALLGRSEEFRRFVRDQAGTPAVLAPLPDAAPFCRDEAR